MIQQQKHFVKNLQFLLSIKNRGIGKASRCFNVFMTPYIICVNGPLVVCKSNDN